jgi:hypothetical protein
MVTAAASGIAQKGLRSVLIDPSYSCFSESHGKLSLSISQPMDMWGWFLRRKENIRKRYTIPAISLAPVD